MLTNIFFQYTYMPLSQLFHFFYELFGSLFPVFRADYAHFLTNGPFAVVIFFILSGQALSVSYIQQRNRESLNRMAIKRYPRLAIPALASCFIVYTLMKCGLVWNVQAAKIVGRQDWLGSFINVDPSFVGMLKDGLFNAFVSFSDYNFFLWTMKYELLGSALVFALLYAYRFLISPVVICLLLGFISLAPAPFISCFFFGVAFSLFHANGFFEKLRENKAWQYLGPTLLAMIVAIDVVYCKQSDQIDRLHILIALLFVFVAQTNKILSRFFEMKLSQILGKLSFPVYLVHLAVLVSVTSWMIVRLPAAPSMADALCDLLSGVGLDCNGNGLIDECEILQGFCLDWNANLVPDECEAPNGFSYCAGDGTAIPCPCGNTGAPGYGCVNSTGQGALIYNAGGTSVALDDAVLVGLHLPANRPGLFIAGDQQLNGGQGVTFNDGILCLVVRKRLTAGLSSATGVLVQTTPAAVSAGLIQPGQTWYFQAWHRSGPGAPCGSPSNISNGLGIVFTP